MVSEQFGIPESSDGILGLAQGYAPKGFNMPNDYERAQPYFIDVLFEAQYIVEKSFSTYFAGRFGDSFVDFGPAQKQEMSDPAEYVEIKVNKGYFYQAVPQGVKFGSLDESNEFVLSGIEAVFTTGLSFSMVPSSIAKDFFPRFLKLVEYVETNGIFYTDCATEMQDVWFMVDSHWIQIRGQDLLTDISEAEDNSLCIINFIPSIDDFWVFGNTIYKDYYVYHNPERGVLGWVPTV